MNATATSATKSEKECREDLVRHLLKLGGYEWDAAAKVWKHKDGRQDRGALADLRSGLGKKPGQMARVHKHVVPYLPQEKWNDRWYYVVATLFGSFPKHTEEWRELPEGKKMRIRTLGKAFKPLRPKSDSMEARFVALLNAHPDDLADHLRHAVSLLKANEQPLDWFRLLDDLIQWDDPEGHVQLRWARDFYAGGG